MILSKITVPMLNANEPEATLVEILAPPSSVVKPGDVLFTIETTKAASDIEAENEGFLRVIAVEGQTLQVGEVIAYITSDLEEPLPAQAEDGNLPKPTSSANLLRITEPARKLAAQLGIDLGSLPLDRMITESFIQNISKPGKLPERPIDPTKIIVYGAGGHAKAIMEMIAVIGQQEIVGIIDDDPTLVGQQVMGYTVLGNASILRNLLNKGVGIAANGVGGIINFNIRKLIFDRLDDNGFNQPAICHPKATIENSAVVKVAVQVFANAYIGSSVVLEPRCMVNTGAIVSHDCVIGELSHIAPGALLAGGVVVGKQVLVGMGVTTAIGVRIGDGCRIGNGSSVLKDVPARTIIPAGKIWN